MLTPAHAAASGTLVIDTDSLSSEEVAEKVLTVLAEKGLIRRSAL